ncbi:MAG: hypothetical protein HYX68_23405 [Planctomycetes bacterium]|nr:hypothetical protein [Planctomycetota bacterium]
MAFNILGTFQKNKRFWMALILMVCMISFVFCTGMKGDMQDRLLPLLGLGSKGQTIGSIAGSRISSRDLHDLRTQRNLADAIMKVCADLAFKKLTKALFENQKKVKGAKNAQKREQDLKDQRNMQFTLAERKNRPRYFDIGIAKFDDLVEFKLWQAEADRLGIHLEDEHLKIVFRQEFFGVLHDDEIFYAQQTAMRNSRDFTNAYVRKAIGEEFRVRIAQLAVLRAQPYSLFFRRAKEGQPLPYKFDNAAVPDETRAPLTLAQLWDFYQKNRWEFDVTLLPVDVKATIKELKDAKGNPLVPNQLQREAFFTAHKDKPNDPSSADFGLEKAAQAQVGYVYADPNSPAYLGLAQAVAQLKVTNPIVFDIMQSPLVTATRFMAIAQKEKADLQAQYDALSRNPQTDKYWNAAQPTEVDFASPILAYLAAQRTDGGAFASLMAASAMSAWNPLEGQNALAGFLAWGAMGKPAADKTRLDEVRKRHEAEVENALLSEMRRRTPLYKDYLGWWALTQVPLARVGPYYKLDNSVTYRHPFGFEAWMYDRPRFTIETVQRDIKDLLARRAAEEWAQENMEIVRNELKKASGDAEKFKRALEILIPKYKLTAGPKTERQEYYTRFNIEGAKEFSVLQEAFEKYVDMINMFEGRDLTPERLLKKTDFQKMFFDGSESFAATSVYRAMSWPPEVRPNLARAGMLHGELDPTLINRRNVDQKEQARFEAHLAQHGPNAQIPNFDLFKTADRPILFWRTAELPPNRPSDLAKVSADLKRFEKRLAGFQKAMTTEKDAGKLDELRRQADDARKAAADLREMLARVTEGWQFEEARKIKALPKAKAIAIDLIKKGRNPDVIAQYALKSGKHVLANLSQMKPEEIATFGNAVRVDYSLPPLPKDTIVYPREDTMTQILKLYDMKAPLSLGNKDLDDVNKALFEMVSKDKTRNNPENFVQILANKPRSVFYVALISAPPRKDEAGFRETMERVPFPQHLVGVGLRNLFAERAQEQQARVYRSQVLVALRKVHNVSFENEDQLRKDFDDRNVAD